MNNNKFGFPKRWQCSECKERWTARLRPEHQHPNHLQRLCSLEECEAVIAPGTRTCSEEHALRAARRVRGLPEDPPANPMTGQWLFSHRQRLHVSRSTVSNWLSMSKATEAYQSNLLRIEVNNLPLPKDWRAICEAIAQATRSDVVDALVYENWPRTRHRGDGLRDHFPQDVPAPSAPAESPAVDRTDTGPEREVGCKRRYDLSFEVHDWAPGAPRLRLLAELRPDRPAKISIACDSLHMTSSRLDSSQSSKLLISMVELLEEMEERASHRRRMKGLQP